MSYSAIRTLSFSVTPSALLPSAPVAAGLQGEHNATQVIFSLDEALQQEDFHYRFEYEDGAGGFDSTDEVTLSNGKVSCFLPRAWTQNGGIGTLRLVLARVGTNGDEQTVYSFAARLKFAGRRREDTALLPEEKPLLSSLLAQASAAAAAAEHIIQTAGNKADRPAAATAGHLAGLDENGDLTDSGVSAADVVTSSQIATQDRPGLVKPDTDNGFIIIDDGVLSILGMSESEIQYRNSFNRHPIPLNALDTAVKQALVNSKDVTYSASDQTAAQTLLGCVGRPTVNTDTSGTIQLMDNVIYQRGTLSEVVVTAPDLTSPEQCCELIFVSGETAATFAVNTGSLTMHGDDCTAAGVFVPQPNRRYDVMFGCDGTVNYGVVMGTGVSA